MIGNGGAQTPSALTSLFDEIFRNVHGHVLDAHTSLIETLATISAEGAFPLAATAARRRWPR
jgi:hypothetical protein